MKKKIWIILIVLVLVSLMAVRLAGNKQKINEKKNTTTETDIKIPVNTVSAGAGEVNETLIKTGTLIPYQEADITATVSGNLVAVNFNLGSQVSKGAVIARIDNTLLQLRLESAQLQQEKLQRDYERYAVLLKGNATTETNLQDIKFNLDNAMNQVSQIKKQISDNEIKAPLSGYAVTKNVEAGEFVNPGTVLGKLVDISRLKVDVMVSENDAYKLATGQKVKITTDLYPGQAFEGKVIFISQQGDAAHNYQVQVELPNSSAYPLKAGTFVYADFIRKSERSALLIPRSALVESLKKPYVYVVENGKAVMKKITVGKETGANIEVLDGLKAGEQVVVNGQINLADGTPVSIVK